MSVLVLWVWFGLSADVRFRKMQKMGAASQQMDISLLNQHLEGEEGDTNFSLIWWRLDADTLLTIRTTSPTQVLLRFGTSHVVFHRTLKQI